jgi:predicted RNase H-like HicB family nuclease
MSHTIDKTHDVYHCFTVNLFLDEDGDYLAYFVELPNVSAFGATRDKALTELGAAWKLMKECYQDDGLAVPKASSRHLP